MSYSPDRDIILKTDIHGHAPDQDIMMKNLALREQYNEEMFEHRANGIETMSFSDWQKRKILIAELFAKSK